MKIFSQIFGNCFCFRWAFDDNELHINSIVRKYCMTMNDLANFNIDFYPYSLVTFTTEERKSTMKNKESRVVLESNQKGIRFYASRRQAKIVFDALIQRYSEKGPPYNTAHVPQSKQ